MNLRFPYFSVTMSVTNQNILDLVVPLAFFSINQGNSTIKIPKHQVNYTKLLLGEQLLNRNIYILLATVIKKRQYIFWGFQHSNKVIQKHDKVIYWICTFCQAINIVKIFSTISIV